MIEADDEERNKVEWKEESRNVDGWERRKR